ncbi:hypothetical protein ACN28S_06775 [Cystobacter fuscus]
MIDALGGTRSDTGEPYRTENAVRGVAKDNPRGRRFDEAATELWGSLHPYTGYKQMPRLYKSGSFLRIPLADGSFGYGRMLNRPHDAYYD